MAPWAEQTHGPEKIGQTGLLRYRAHECTTAAQAQAAMEAQIAKDYPDGPFGHYTMQLPNLVSVDSPGEWNCVANYGPPGGTLAEPPDTDSPPTYRFKIGNERRRTTLSLATTGSYGRNDTPAPDMHGLIGVSDKGVEGCELGDTSGALLFSMTHYIPNAKVTTQYITNLSKLVWHTNQAAFQTYEAETVLYLGASGGKRGTGDWEITHDFAMRPHVDDACADWSPDSGFGAKNLVNPRAVFVMAWEYLWAYQTKEEIEFEISAGPPAVTKKKLVYRPLFLYVERVYHSGDFSLLEP